MTQVERAVVERFIAAAPDRVYGLLTSAEGWLRWQGTEASVDARPGGVVRVDVTGDGVAAGRFEELVPGRRVVFTWGWEGPDHPVPPGSSRVEIDLVPEGRGTRLRLTHTVGAPGFGPKVEAGWRHYGARLAAAAEGADPGPDPWRVGAGE
jgi:uncharacterized protein YndB with AHSA1/START domain